MAQVLGEGLARNGLVQPFDRAGVGDRGGRVMAIGAGHSADRDAAGHLAGQHHQVADPDGVDELVHLGGEVAQRVGALGRVGRGQDPQDRLTVLEARQIGDLAKARQQPALGDGLQLPLAMAAGANDPKPGHAASAVWTRPRTSILPVTAAEIRAARRS